MYLNKAMIIGNLTRDPELKSLPSGVQVSSFGVATNSVWRDKDGNKKEDTQYHNIVVFGRQAETVSQYLRKGSSVLVEGRIQTRSWEGQDGKKNYRTEIVADRVQFGPKSSGSSAANQAVPEDKSEETPPLDTIEYPEGDPNVEDIPF
jgi:single-strand DNA-binding protein